MTDVPPDRAARVLSACQELEKVALNKLYLRQSVTACLGNYLPSVAFSVARVLVLVLVLGPGPAKRVTAIVNKTSISFHPNQCVSTA